MDPVQPPVIPSSANAIQTNEDTSRDYAGFRRRLGANIIDGFILTLVSLSIGFSLGFGGMKPGGLSSLIGFLIGVGYTIFFWVSQNGQTLGKRAMAIRIVKENGKSVDLATATVRYIGYIISSVVLFLGFIWVLFDSKKQGWHDKIARTYVIKTGGKPKTWLVILLIILPILLFFIFIVALVGLAASGKISGPQMARILTPILIEEKFENKTPGVDNLTANQILNGTIEAVNKYRLDNHLPVFEVDSRLCAYAKRRLEQLSSSKLGNDWYDSGKGFYEDTANPNIYQAYFTAFTSESENVFHFGRLVPPDQTAKHVVDTWTKGEQSNLKNKDITASCIQIDPQSQNIIFIGGVKKK